MGDDDSYGGGNRVDRPSGMMPDHFDMVLADLGHLSKSSQTQPSIVRTIRPMGVGGTDVYIVQTFRVREEDLEGDVILLEVTNRDGHLRVVLPQAVTAVVHRQHASLTDKARRAGAQRAIKTRIAGGFDPGEALRIYRAARKKAKKTK